MKRNPCLGLTQLELMISLAIMGLIAVLLANALNFSRISLDRSRYLSEETAALLTRQTFRNWIEDMPLEYGTETAQAFFYGDADSLHFKSLVSDGTFWLGAPAQFTLELQTLDDTKRISLTGHGRPSEQAEQIDINRVLANQVAIMDISYYGRKSAETEKSWHLEWSDEIRLPDLVKVEWEYNNGNPAPPLTLEPAKSARHKYMSLSSLVPPG